MTCRQGKKIFERIAFLRGDETLTAFARNAGVNYRAVQKFFQRRSAPDSESLANIARAYRVSLDWLVTGERAVSKLDARIGKKIRLVRKINGWSVEEFGRRMNMSARALELYENGMLTFSTDMLQEFAKCLGVPPQDLLVEGQVSPAQAPELKVFNVAGSRLAPTVRGEDYVSIPLTESAIAAGQPIIQENSIEDYVLLHIRAVGKRGNLVASRVDGDSMEPTLHSGDIVVIDRDDKKIAKNAMYAIFHENGLTAKYVERQKTLLILRPLNPNSQIQVINLYEHPDPIVGKIIGAWKTF
jgi:transcriptional regulator with XRE-family HTH domain